MEGGRRKNGGKKIRELRGRRGRMDEDKCENTHFPCVIRIYPVFHAFIPCSTHFSCVPRIFPVFYAFLLCSTHFFCVLPRSTHLSCVLRTSRVLYAFVCVLYASLLSSTPFSVCGTHLSCVIRIFLCYTHLSVLYASLCVFYASLLCYTHFFVCWVPGVMKTD